MWVLASYGVRPSHQGRGVGRLLLEAALHHGRGCLRGMLSASSDPRAVRRYHLAGFRLHPQMYLTGRVDRAVLPVVDHMREGSAGDIDLLNSVDRQSRGAAHLSDHEVLVRQYRLVVTDRPTGSGYVYLDAFGSPQLLAATNRRTATALLWEALATRPLVDASDKPRHRRERLGGGRRHGRPDGSLHRGVPRAARDEAAARRTCHHGSLL